MVPNGLQFAVTVAVNETEEGVPPEANEVASEVSENVGNDAFRSSLAAGIKAPLPGCAYVSTSALPPAPALIS